MKLIESKFNKEENRACLVYKPSYLDWAITKIKRILPKRLTIYRYYTLKDGKWENLTTSKIETNKNRIDALDCVRNLTEV